MARKTAPDIDRQAADEFLEETSPVNIGGQPRSEVTGKHDEGSGANETEDGLDEVAESIRHNAEDIPTGRGDDFEKLPVFDRAEAERKI
jgi:hypothetical protein